MIAYPATFRKLLADQKGATAVEYGLIASLIVIAMMSGLSALGGGSDGMWTNIGQKVEAATNGGD